MYVGGQGVLPSAHIKYSHICFHILRRHMILSVYYEKFSELAVFDKSSYTMRKWYFMLVLNTPPINLKISITSLRNGIFLQHIFLTDLKKRKRGSFSE